MGQLFHPSANAIAAASLTLGVIAVAALASLGLFIERSPYTTLVGVALPQPIQFSHQHHVEALGIDCRYCHVPVENSSFAGIPPTETCMHCHSEIWRDSSMLAPVRLSWENDDPIEWTRVHDLPDYVYFNHEVHIAKGVGCAECHGRIDKMPLTWRTETLNMDWCLECHRDPATRLRPREEIFNMKWSPAGDKDREALGRRLMELYDVRTDGLTDCWTCHR